MSDDPVRALRELVEQLKKRSQEFHRLAPVNRLESFAFRCEGRSDEAMQCAADLEALLPALEQRERELRDALEWAYLQIGGLKAAAWKILEKTRPALNPEEKQT